MEITVQLPFRELLLLVKTLTPQQKAVLKAELNEVQALLKPQDDFIAFLLAGPVYSEEDIAIIEENRKSISKWRTKK